MQGSNSQLLVGVPPVVREGLSGSTGVYLCLSSSKNCIHKLCLYQCFFMHFHVQSCVNHLTIIFVLISIYMLCACLRISRLLQFYAYTDKSTNALLIA